MMFLEDDQVLQALGAFGQRLDPVRLPAQARFAFQTHSADRQAKDQMFHLSCVSKTFIAFE